MISTKQMKQYNKTKIFIGGFIDKKFGEKII